MLHDNDNVTPIWGPHVTTAKEAKRLKSKYYFTGKPCARGHIAPRYAHGSCTQCKEENRRANREKNRLEAKEWRASNPDKTKGYHEKKAASGYGKEYYQRNRESEIAKAIAWNAKNPERAKATNRRWREAHKEEINLRFREEYAANPEQKREAAAAYRAANRRLLADYSRAWRQANPELVRVMDRNKKLRRRGAEGSHTTDDIEKIMVRQKHKCAECGCSVRYSYHVDHIEPLARGGTNWPTNLQILCPPCNMAKHATDPIVFAQRKGRLL